LASSAVVAITSYPTNRTFTKVSVLKIWATLFSSPSWMKKPLSLHRYMMISVRPSVRTNSFFAMLVSLGMSTISAQQ
jgi:hypothetical protein